MNECISFQFVFFGGVTCKFFLGFVTLSNSFLGCYTFKFFFLGGCYTFHKRCESSRDNPPPLPPRRPCERGGATRKIPRRRWAAMPAPSCSVGDFSRSTLLIGRRRRRRAPELQCCAFSQSTRLIGRRRRRRTVVLCFLSVDASELSEAAAEKKASGDNK